MLSVLSSLSRLRDKRRANVLFLASHGLRGHLSALRWAAGRLRKSGPLTREQRLLAAEIHSHSRALTTAMHAMLLLGRLEEGELHPASVTPVEPLLRETFTSQIDDSPPVHWTHYCDPGLAVLTQEEVLHSLFENIRLLCTDAVSEPRRVLVDAKRSAGTCRITFTAAWRLPLLGSWQAGDWGAPLAVGGTPGLSLALAAQLAKAAGGNVDLEAHSPDDGMVMDGTVEGAPSGEEGYRIVVRFPAA